MNTGCYHVRAFLFFVVAALLHRGGCGIVGKDQPDSKGLTLPACHHKRVPSLGLLRLRLPGEALRALHHTIHTCLVPGQTGRSNCASSSPLGICLYFLVVSAYKTLANNVTPADAQERR